MVISREADFHVLGFAFLHADDAGFEFRQHLALAQHEREVLTRTASESFAVDLAGKVDDHAVGIGSGALDTVEAGALLAQHVDGLVDFGVSNFAHGLFDFLAVKAAQGQLGVDFKGSAELEFASGRIIVGSRFETRVTGDAQFLLGHSLGETKLDLFAQHVFAHGSTVVTLDHLQRGLARAETGDLGRAGHAGQTLLHLGVDVGKRQCDIEAAFEVAERFQLNLHVCSLKFVNR